MSTFRKLASDIRRKSNFEEPQQHSPEELAESFVNGNISAVMQALLSTQHNYDLAINTRNVLRDQFGQDAERFTQILILKLFERIP